MEERRCYNPASCEQGAVLILIALLAVVLFLFIGLSIDTARMGSGHQKHSRLTELSVIGGLEAYIATSPGLGTTYANHLAKLDASVGRIEEVINFTRNAMVGAQEATYNVTDKIEWRQGSARGPSGSSDAAGFVTVGKYFFAEPPDGCPSTQFPDIRGCPCGGATFKECFRPNATLDEEATALELTLRTEAGNPVETIFAMDPQTLENYKFDFSAKALATIVPRHIGVMIDASPSTTTETHNSPRITTDLDDASTYFSQNAFQLNTSANCTGTYTDASPPPVCAAGTSHPSGSCGNLPPSYHEDYLNPPGSLNDMHSGCSYSSKGPDIDNPGARFVWDGIATLAWNKGMYKCRNGAAYDATTRYRDDYVCADVDVDGNGSIDTGEPKFLVERETIVNGTTYRGPEPLTTILRSINTMLGRLETFTIPGDRVLFILFDSDVERFEGRVFGPTGVGETEFTTLKSLTDVDDNSTAAVNARIRAGFFSRASGTDLAEAFLRGYEEITNLPFSDFSDKSFFVFSDGVANCSHFNGPGCGGACPATSPPGAGSENNFEFFGGSSPSGLDFLHVDTGTSPPSVKLGTNSGLTHKPCTDFGDPYQPPFPAFSGFGADAFKARNLYLLELMHRKALLELETLATGSPLNLPSQIKPFSESDIKVHTFLFGDYVQPHNLLLKNEAGQNGCMNEADARNGGHSFTEGSGLGDFYNLDTRPYLEPNKFFQDVIGKATEGRYVPVRDACDFAAAGISLSTACNQGGGIAHLDAVCDGVSGAAGTVVPASEDIPGILEGGKLLCNPLCLNKQQEIDRQIAEALRDSPLLLVAEPNFNIAAAPSP